MRKFAYKFKLKAKDACRDAGKGLLKAALCLTAIAGSTVAAWAAPTSLTMYVESGQNSGINNPKEVIPMSLSSDKTTFTADFVCMDLPYGWIPAAGLVFIDNDRENYYWGAGDIGLDTPANLTETAWYAPSTKVRNCEVGTTYTVTIKFPNGGNQGNITVTRAAVQQEVKVDQKITDVFLVLNRNNKETLIPATYDETTKEFTVIYKQKANDQISFKTVWKDNGGEKVYKSIGGSFGVAAELTFAENGNATPQACGDNIGWRKVVLKEAFDHSLKAVFSETTEPELTNPQINSVILKIANNGAESTVNCTYNVQDKSFEAVYNQKQSDCITLIVNGEMVYGTAIHTAYDKTAEVLFEADGTQQLQASNSAPGWRKVVLKETADHSLKAVFCESEEPVVEFVPNIESVALRLYTKVDGSSFYRDVEVPYNAETGEFAGNFLLSLQDNISLMVNGTNAYKLGADAAYDETNGEYIFQGGGSHNLRVNSMSNYGWRHVVLKENVDHSLTAVFSEGEVSPETLADATLKVVKPDGSVNDVPMVANGLSWSAKDVPLEVGDKPYVQFSDGVYVKYPGTDYVFETKKPDNKSMPMAQMVEKPVDMNEFPAVTKAGQYTFSFYYVLNDNAIYAPLYLSRKIITLEDPEMSVWRDGQGGEPEFVSLMDFVLLEKLADAVVDLKEGETIFLKYGEEEIPVELANVETFAGEHALSDAAAESTRLTVPSDGTYRLRLDMKNGRKLVVEAVSMPGKLWYIPGNFNTVSEAALNGKVALVPAKDGSGHVVPGKYVSETEIALNGTFFITDSVDKFYTVDSEGNTVLQNVNGQPDYALGGSYNSNATRTKFEPGKSVLLLDWKPNTGSNTSPFSVAENVLQAAEKHLMYVDISTEANKILKWGNIMDYKGKEYYLIGCDGIGTLTDGCAVEAVPGTAGNEKYKFIYHPTTNLYTLTLDEVWGKLAITTKDGGTVGRYTAIKNNELINTIGSSYDLYYGYTEDGSDRTTKPYTDDEGNELQNENWNYFVINDPACADGMVKVADSGQVAYCYYKDITIVFDPDNNRLWMQSPNKDFEYDPTKDPINIEQPLYIVFCRKVSATDKQEAYEVVKVRPMIQSKRKDLSYIPEYALDEVVDGKKKASAPRRAALRRADAATGAAEEESEGVTYGYYTTGNFGSYDGREIDPTMAGWCHPESWPAPDSFTDIFVKPGGVPDDNNYDGIDYNLAYFFFTETDGYEYATKDEHGNVLKYDINKMIDHAVHLHCDQNAVTQSNFGYQVGDGTTTTTTTTTTTIPGSPNETAPRFYNQDFTSGIQATRKILNEQHAAGNEDCSADHLSMHMIAIDSTEPFYVELDRSGSQANTRITRAENELYFIAYYKTLTGENKFISCKMDNKDPETGEISKEYPYYYESSEWLPLKECVWTAMDDKIKNPNVFGRCNFFFSSKTDDSLRDIITRSLNASALVTSENPFDDMKMEICYDEDKIDENGYAYSNVQEMAHNFSRTFFNTDYEVGSGKALNYFKLDFGDENDPNYDKGDMVYKVCLWLKGSVKEPPVDPFEEQPSNAPRRAAAMSGEPLEVSKVQLVRTLASNIKTGVEEVVDEPAPRVTVDGLCINVEGGGHVVISDTQGRLMYSGKPCSGIEMAGRGIYIVNVDGDATKVIVR